MTRAMKTPPDADGGGGGQPGPDAAVRALQAYAGVRAEGDYQQHLRRLAASLIPPFTVSHETPEVRAVLEDLLTDDAAGDALADLLRQRGDPRAESVRELVGTPWAQPKRAPRPDKRFLMARGTWFVLECDSDHPSRVVGTPSPGTWQYRHLRKGDGCGARRNLKGRSREDFGAAVAWVHSRLIYRLMEIDEYYLVLRREILAEERVSAVARMLLDADAPQKWVPLARELRVAAPGRYKDLCDYTLTRPEYEELYLALFDADRADGRARLDGGAR